MVEAKRLRDELSREVCVLCGGGIFLGETKEGLR
jgi:hypothetical protein